MKRKHTKNFTFFLLVLAVFIVLTGCIDIDSKGNINILININIAQEPAKTTYYVNETFDSSGLIVNAYYWDDTLKRVTDYSLSRPDMGTSGTKTITVTYMLMTATFNITVIDALPDVTVNSINIKQNPTKTTYYVNEEFNTDGLIVRAVYSDGSSTYISAYSISRPDMGSVGKKTVTINYLGMTVSFNITVIAAPQGVSLSSINVTQPPVKTSFYVNEAFNSAGLVVTANYSDGSSRNVTGYSISTPDMGKTGTKTVTVTFEGKTANFSITVSAAPQGVYLTSITVTKNPTKNTYYINETFDSAGLAVTANYSDGTSEQVSGYFLSTPNMSTAGTKTVTVTYQGKNVNFNITVIADAPDEGDLGVIIY